MSLLLACVDISDRSACLWTSAIWHHDFNGAFLYLVLEDIIGIAFTAVKKGFVMLYLYMTPPVNIISDPKKLAITS